MNMSADSELPGTEADLPDSNVTSVKLLLEEVSVQNMRGCGWVGGWECSRPLLEVCNFR